MNGEEKYAEEYDYQEGFQLAGLTLQGTTAGQQFGLNAYGWGESPTATMDGWMAKSNTTPKPIYACRIYLAAMALAFWPLKICGSG